MSKAKVYDISGKQIEEIDLPTLFDTPLKLETIKKAVLAIQANKRQPYGSSPLAGQKSSAHYHAARHYRYTMMNKETARISRIHGNVGYMAMRARIVPQSTKGRRAHPPKAEKIWSHKINTKERRIAIKSALAATANLELVQKRGHKSEISPIIFNDDFEAIEKTKDAKALLEILISKEIKRCSRKKVRAGKGTMRGRKYNVKKGPLIVVSKKCKAIKAFENILGVDVATVVQVNAEILAPGTHAGRLTIYTKSAIAGLEKKFGA